PGAGDAPPRGRASAALTLRAAQPPGKEEEMDGERPPPTGDEGRLEEVIAAYVQAVEAGQTPQRAELRRRDPDLAADLERFFADFERVDRAAETTSGPLQSGPMDSRANNRRGLKVLGLALALTNLALWFGVVWLRSGFDALAGRLHDPHRPVVVFGVQELL